MADYKHYLKNAFIIGPFVDKDFQLVDHIAMHFTSMGCCVTTYRSWLTSSSNINAYINCANLQKVNNADLVVNINIKGRAPNDSLLAIYNFAKELKNNGNIPEIIEAVYDEESDTITFSRDNHQIAVVNNYLHDKVITFISEV